MSTCIFILSFLNVDLGEAFCRLSGVSVGLECSLQLCALCAHCVPGGSGVTPGEHSLFLHSSFLLLIH